MKNKQRFLLVLISGLLCFSQEFAYASKDNDKTIRSCVQLGVIGATGIAVSACKLSPFSVLELMAESADLLDTYDFAVIQNDHLQIQDTHPYAQKWFEGLSKKYTQAGLDSMKLLKLSHTYDQKMYTWATFGDRIYSNLEILKNINEVYKKKSDGECLTDVENALLSRSEWSVLHEAGHKKNNDCLKNQLVSLGLVAGLEFSYKTLYEKIFDYGLFDENFSNVCGVALSLSVIMMYSHSYIKNYHSRFMETRADNFANRLAEDHALRAAIVEFKIFEKKSQDESLFAAHPTVQSRIQAMQNELIARSSK